MQIFEGVQQQLVAVCHTSLPPSPSTEFSLTSSHVEFVVNKVALGRIVSKYFGFPRQSSFQQLFHVK
jgi:hypothetical protein